MATAYGGLGFIVAMHRECMANHESNNQNAWICFGGERFDEVYVHTKPSKEKRQTTFLGSISPDTVCHQLRNYRFEKLDAAPKPDWLSFRLVDPNGRIFSLETNPKDLRVERVKRALLTYKPVTKRSKTVVDTEAPTSPIQKKTTTVPSQKTIRTQRFPSKPEYRIVRAPGNLATGTRQLVTKPEYTLEELLQENARLRACINNCLQDLNRLREAHGSN
jgi:hypothetical protein